MVLAGQRPRTVLGRLVGRACPLGRRGLRPLGWLPLGLAGPAVLVRSPGCGCSGGSSPAAGPLAAAGHACPSPRPVAERTPADHRRRRMVDGNGGDRGSPVLQGGEPVLAAPPARVGGVGCDHRHACIRGHLGEPVPELPCGEARDYLPEAPSAPTAGRPAAVALVSLLAGAGEVKVFDRDRPAAVLAGNSGQLGDGGAQPPVALRGGQPRQDERDRHGRPGRVPVRGDHPRVEVAAVQVDREDRGLAQVV